MTAYPGLAQDALQLYPTTYMATVGVFSVTLHYFDFSAGLFRFDV